MNSKWENLKIPEPGDMGEYINMLCSQSENIKKDKKKTVGAFTVLVLEKEEAEKDIDNPEVSYYYAPISHYFAEFGEMSKVEFMAMITTILIQGNVYMHTLHPLEQQQIMGEIVKGINSFKERNNDDQS